MTDDLRRDCIPVEVFGESVPVVVVTFTGYGWHGGWYWSDPVAIEVDPAVARAVGERVVRQRVRRMAERLRGEQRTLRWLAEQSEE
jgi:hypothetical protein